MHARGCGRVTPADDVVRIGLVHPFRAWLEALECALGPEVGAEVVIANTNPAWVRAAVERHEVDLVLVGLPGDGALSAIRAMRQASGSVGLVVISDSTDPATISDVVRAGVRGWVTSTSTLKHLLEVVRGVARGESWFPPRLVTVLVDHLLETEHARRDESDALAGLSARQREILDCLTQGMTRHEIAEQLFLSPHTVRTHINHMLHKLSVHSTLAAVSVARSAQLPTDQDGIDPLA